VKPAVLERTYTTALDGALAIGARSVALCCISTGIFGYPIEQATPVALSTVRRWLDLHPGAFDALVFCVFQAQDVAVYEKWMPLFFPLAASGGAPAPAPAPAPAALAPLAASASDLASDR
jgi:hypothetical protein